MKRLRARTRVAVVGLVPLLVACARDRSVDPAAAGTVHAAGFADPASPTWHGALLRAERWSGMLDPGAKDACGRCHDGAPGRVTGVSSFAPGAPACTTCHAEPDGPLACSTCHSPGEAHAAHVQPSVSAAAGLPCSTCHPAPGNPVIGGLHGDGHVDIAFDPARVARVGTAAAYDATTRECAGTCHDRDGARPRPRWSDTASAGCGDCHGSPPAAHFAGPCTGCHAEANANGTALTGGPLHMNGRVDLGHGGSGCGACHGAGDDPWPTTGAHRAHASPSIASPVACAECHVVPAAVGAPGHLDGIVGVTFAGPASTARRATPSWDGQRCSTVACHGAKLVDAPSVIPAWRDGTGVASACGACHGIPPTQHTPSTSCGRSTCHGTEVTRDATGALSITPGGTSVHIDGTIDHAL
jgi:predicted CxxxxCH...CXXCH cytochrome family protein